MTDDVDRNDALQGGSVRADRQQWDEFLQGSFSFEDVQFLSCLKHEADDDGAEEMELLLWNYGLNKKMTDWEENQAMQRQLNNTTGFRGWCFRLSQMSVFKNGIMALIVVNIACVAFDAEVGIKNVVDPENKPPQEMIEIRKVLEHVFTAVFLVEILVRTIGSPVYVWKDAWLMFDSFIVYAAVLDAWILKPLALGGSPSSLGVLRVLRLFRAFRAMRILRLFRFAWPLRVLAEALADAFLGIFWIIVIVTFLTFTVSVVATATVGAITVEGDDSGSESISPFNTTSTVPTLNQLFNHVADSMTAINYVHLRGLYWGPTMAWPLLFSNNLQEVFLGAVLTGYILLALMALASLILGTFVTIVMGAKGRDEQAVTREGLLEKTSYLQKLAEVYLAMDANGDGRVTLEEFREGLEENMKLCHLLGVPMDKVDTIYSLANNKSSQGEPASVDDLMIGVLKHTGMSRTIEQLSLDHQQQRVRRSISLVVYHYNNGIQTLKDLLDKLARDLAALTQRVQMLAEALRATKVPEEILTNHMEQLKDAPKLNVLLSHSVERSLLNDLDVRYRFKSRLLEAELGLAEEAENAPNDASAALAIAPAIFKEVISEEVMPWIQRELRSVQAKRAASSQRAHTRPEKPHSATSEGSPGVAQSQHARQQQLGAVPPEQASPALPPQQDENVGGQEGRSRITEGPQIWQALANEVRKIDHSSPWYQQ